MLAMRRAVLRLGCLPDLALIDGNRAPDLPCLAETVVDGDRDVPVIGAASIVAKVGPRPPDAPSRQPLPGLWLGNQRGLCDLGASRGGAAGSARTCHHRRSFATVQATLI